MPRRKPTEEEIDEWHRQGCARLSWLSTHPEEMMKEQTAEVERYKKRAAKNLKKHQPVVTNMNFNGEFVTVDFTRNNGERVNATFRLCRWGRRPASLWNQRDEEAVERVARQRQGSNAMPRRKWTEQELDESYRRHRRGLERWAWLSNHPEEWLKERSAQRDRYERLAQAHLKKFQPVIITDIDFNGEFVHVEFTRNNGERVAASYKLCIWGQPPASLWNQRERKALARVRALDAAEGQPPPQPGKA
jgi:hypothetical protein